MAFAQSPFGQFMASPAGRVLRVVAGAVLVVWGIWGLKGTAGVVIAIIGLVPLGAGLFDVCVLSALFGGPFSGREIRAATQRKKG
jgi:hypothetical protein